MRFMEQKFGAHSVGCKASWVHIALEGYMQLFIAAMYTTADHDHGPGLVAVSIHCN
jgi:hypothetical protein